MSGSWLFKTKIASDVHYYKNIRNYNKASEMPLSFRNGCGIWMSL
jgi:hypothetical protein